MTTTTPHHRYGGRQPSSSASVWAFCYYNDDARYDAVRFPPTPSPSPHDPHDRDAVGRGATMLVAGMDQGGGGDDDDDNDAEYKPYCDSRRGEW